ncbi:exodeoxyribonuclease VII large subunit [Candidatus Pacearchaeota archaeon CG10_big_fil_rev_8_21_14_0_10_35_13]|nr:MAG: exodeoxyribonuclease VII large subunit [Candidatus Pacearchaeota archaeon CG10_big_fil_rev_8_21_14_0_10_35_13]
MNNQDFSETVQETLKLYTEGFTIKEIADLRSLTESTIYSHLATLILNKKIELENIIVEDKKVRIVRVIKEKNTEKLSEIKLGLDETISYGEIACVLAHIKKDTELMNEKAQVVETTIMSVNELTSYIKNLIESDHKLNNLLVRGEISNLTFNKSGHVYFSIKDKESQIRCVMFRRIKESLMFNLEHGMKIIIKGNIEVYQPKGEYQIIVEEVQPDGLGALNLAFIQLKERLKKEGLFSEAHKKPLPKFPKTIGIITSPTGAALQDMIKVIKRRYPLTRIMIAPTPVQGKESVRPIIESITTMNEMEEIDVIILGRGGGSLEDLWCFNEESVARAVYESRIPIISAVGHETDYTIMDFVADYRAPTPSAAAEAVVPNIEEILEALNNYYIRNIQATKYAVDTLNSLLKQIISRTIFKRPYDSIHSYYKELDHELYKIQTIIVKKIETKRKILEIIESKITTLSPKSILKRGYSIVMKEGKIIKNSSEVNIGSNVNILLHEGSLEAKITQKTK